MSQPNRAEDPYSVLVPSGIVVLEGAVGIMEPYDTIDPKNKVVTRELLQEVSEVEAGTFSLVANSIDMDILGMPASALINELTDLSKTRRESSKGLLFGQLIVRSVFNEERAALVALKPFKTAKEAAHEFSLGRYFKGAGKSHGFRTFEPLGIARLENGKFGLLTSYDHGVRSLDNEVWNPANALNSIAVSRAIGKAALVIASMHASGWTHGDAQIKNIFASNHQELFIADLESTQPFKQKHGNPVIPEIERSIEHDIRALAMSLPNGRGHEVVPDELLDMFSTFYTTIIRNPKSEVPEELRKSSKYFMQLMQSQY